MLTRRARAMSIVRLFRLRFSLKFLLLAMTVICVFVSFWATSARRQKQAVADILRAGGSVKYDFSLAGAAEPPEPKWLVDLLGVDFLHTVEWAAEFREMRAGDDLYDVFGKRGGRVFADDSFVRVVDRLPRLKSLEVITFDTSFAGLAFLDKLDHLERLIISYRGSPQTRPSVGGGLDRLWDRTSLRELSIKSIDRPDDGLSFLENLRELESLTIVGMPFEPDDLRFVSTLPKLQKLNLSRSNVNSDTLVWLAKLEGLRELNLCETTVDNAGLRHLAGLSELRKLMLEETNVDSEGVKHLSGLRQLTYLLLDGTYVDKEAFETLKQLTNLTELWLSSQTVSREDARALKQLLPDCLIRLTSR